MKGMFLDSDYKTSEDAQILTKAPAKMWWFAKSTDDGLGTLFSASELERWRVSNFS